MDINSQHQNETNDAANASAEIISARAVPYHGNGVSAKRMEAHVHDADAKSQH